MRRSYGYNFDVRDVERVAALARMRGISASALAREIFETYLKENPPERLFKVAHVHTVRAVDDVDAVLRSTRGDVVSGPSFIVEEVE